MRLPPSEQSPRASTPLRDEGAASRLFHLGLTDWQVFLFSVADVEQVAQHLNRSPLLSFTEESRDRDLNELAQQVEQGRFDRGHGMDRDALIESLQPATACVPIPELPSHRIQDAISRH